MSLRRENEGKESCRLQHLFWLISTNLFYSSKPTSLQYFILQMIEDIQTESVAELTANPRVTRTIFNPYQPFTPPVSSTSIQPQAKECRICLENTNHQDNQLLNLCKCTGSVKYIHDKCFRKWVESQLHQKSKKEQEKILNQGVECQICKDNITLLFEASYRCNCDFFYLKVKRNPIGFAIFILVFSLVLACIIYLGYNSSRISLDFSSDLVTAIIIISAFAILTLAEVFLLYYCLSDYFLDKFWVLQNYMKKAIPTRRSMRIVPQQL